MSERTVMGGRYRVIEPLGAGGTADVYLGEQLSLKRKVALKVITRRHPLPPDAQARFKREALLQSTIEHPSVVRILDFEAEGPSGTIVVLEYVEGTRLDRAIDGRAMDHRRAARFLLQLAEGLAAIHAKGVVHRDFKAENVMLSDGPTGTQARLLDFGLARLFDADLLDGDGRSFVSSAGITAATPAYASPEQLRGLPATPRSDVYAFGITAYFMLTGRLPFTGPEPHDFIRQHTEERVPSLVGKVPDELAALVARCTEKDPARRPADGEALVAALTPVMAVEAEDILPPTAIGPAHKPAPVQRKSRGGAVLAVVGSLLLGGAAFFAVERPWRADTQARWLLRLGKPDQALERLSVDDASQQGLRALALHALGRSDDVGQLVSQRCLAVVSGLDAAERAQLGVSFASCNR